MKKALRGILDRLRTATTVRLRKPTSTRDGLQVPQRLQALSASPRMRPVR